MALFNKDWNTYKTNWQNANGIGGKIGSIFTSSNTSTSVVSNEQVQILRNWNNAVKHGCTNQETFNRIIANADDNTKMYFAGLNKGKGSIEGLKNAQKVATQSTIGLTIAQTALNMAITMGITALVSLIMKGYDELANSVENCKERVDDLMSSYKSALDTANSNASRVEELADKYEDLSKGVNSLGENISLTNEEYKEYNSLVNEIAEMFPTLVQGYTGEGNAILNLKGNVEGLRDAYKEAQQEAYNLLITSSKDADGNDIIKQWEDTHDTGFWASMLDLGADDVGGGISVADALEQLRAIQQMSADEFREIVRITGSGSRKEIAGLTDIEKEIGYGSYLYKALGLDSNSTDEEFRNAQKQSKALIQTYNAEIESALSDVETLANAYLMTNDDYDKLDEQSKTAASLIVNSLNTDIANRFSSKEDVAIYVDEIVQSLLGNEDVRKALVELFTMDTSDMSINEIQQKVDEYVNTVATELDEDPAELKVRLGFDDTDTKPLIENVKKKLKGTEFDDKVGELNLGDLKIAADLEVGDDTIQSWDDLIERIDKVKSETFNNKTDNLSRKLEEINTDIKNLDSVFSNYEKNGYLAQDEVASILEENPEYIYYLTKFGEQYKLNQQALEEWENVVEEQKDAIDNQMGENSYLKNYEELLNIIKNNSSHSIGNGVGSTRLSEEQLDSLIDKNKELNQSLFDNKISVTEYFNSISENITSSGLESALESIKGEFDDTTDYIEQTVSVLSTELSDALLQSNKRFLKGETSVSDYMEELKAGTSVQQKLLKSTYGLTINQDGYAGSVEDANEATQDAIDSYNALVDAQTNMSNVDSFVNTLSENANFIQNYTDDFGNLMDTIFDDNRMSAYVNSLSQDLVDFARLSQDNMNSVVQALEETAGIGESQARTLIAQGADAVVSTVGSSLSALQGMTNFAMGTVGDSITNTSSAIGDVLTSLGKAISGFNYKIEATPHISGGFKLKKDENGNPTGISLPTFGFDIKGSGGSSIQRFATSLTNAGNYFSQAGASQASSKALDIGSYVPSGSRKGVTTSGKRPSTTNQPDSGGSGGSKEQKETPESFNWIERSIKKVQRTITTLSKTVSETWQSWTTRNNALSQQLSSITDEISLQQKAYNEYMYAANSVGLSSAYQKLVKDGAVRLEDISNEDLKDKIKRFQDFYDKALEAQDAVQDLNNELMQLKKTSFDNVAKQYENRLSVIEHEANMLNGTIDILENQGYLISAKLYDSLIQNEQNRLSELQAEYEALNKQMDGIEPYTEMWYEMQENILNVKEEIQDCINSLIEHNNALRDLDWGVFDMLQERISSITSETDFLMELMSDEKMFDDNGITEQGRATLGLHAVNFNTYMAQADEYAKELEKLNADLADDPNNKTLLERREELLEAQRDMILSAGDEKQAIKDLMSEGYDNLLDTMGKIIDKRKEMFSQIKDLYDYEKSVSEQTKEIADLEKILNAYKGDNSEEAQSSIQQYKVQLEEARQNLEETEYEKYISDHEKMLDKLSSETEEWVNARLDNIEELIHGVIDSTNENAETIKTTLQSEAANVGITLSEKMDAIWDTNGSFTSVVSGYAGGFDNQMTTVNHTLTGIKDLIASMVKDSDAKANEQQSQYTKPSAPVPPATGGTSGSKGSPSSPSPGSSSGSSGWESALVYAKYYGNKSSLNTSTSIVDLLKLHDFSANFNDRASLYRAMGGSGSYVG